MSLPRLSRRVLCTIAAVAAMASGAQAGTLRICADPDNLPFSKADGPERGLYVELAELVSRRIGESAEYVWWLTFNQRRALRNTILQDGCDAYFALPADADYKLRGLQRTRAFLDVSYALVAPQGMAVSGLQDLKGKRIGVIHGSPPHILLAMRDGFTSTSFRHHEEALAALAKGEVDAAILWGPSAGYENARKLGGRWQVTPVAGEGLAGQVAVAVPRGKDDLARRIDQALADLQPQIQELARKYGFPVGKGVPLSSAARASDTGRVAALAEGRRVPAHWVQAAGPAHPDRTVPGSAIVLVQAQGPAAAAAAPVSDVKAGRTRFNDACSHCHGTDGYSPVSERDLRRLKRRYKDDWQQTALKTIQDGRVDLGMPSWKTTYSQKEIDDVLGFLATIQR